MQWSVRGAQTNNLTCETSFNSRRSSFSTKREYTLAGAPRKYRDLRSKYSSLILMDRLWQLIYDRELTRYSSVIGWVPSVVSPDNRKLQKALLRTFIMFASFYLSAAYLLNAARPLWALTLDHHLGREEDQKKRLNGVYFSILIMSSPSLHPSSHFPSSTCSFIAAS